jgi:protein tyrosine phosphatase (PTP) superfamily phosphohydrolase (DUF442 family)
MGAGSWLASAGDVRVGADSRSVALPLPSTHLQHLFRASTNVFSGSAPDGDAAFDEIAALGVKTLISVDGVRPDVAAAHRRGLRYIHLPVGYDGIATNRVVELVNAARFASGPLYVHCHHGQHRGPAAVAVICEATANWTTNQAVAWLKAAGTSTDYPGLYRSAMEFRRAELPVWDGITDLPEVARTSSLVEAMVEIDAGYERLKAAQKAGWKILAQSPVLDPAETSTILLEHLRELARSDDTIQRPDDYRTRLAAAEKSAGHLRATLRDAQSSPNARDTAFRSLSANCVVCHKRYRD